MISYVIKRDGSQVPFDRNRITQAIFNAAKSVGGNNIDIADELTDEVVKAVDRQYEYLTPEVEQIQDLVEKVLIEQGHAKTAKSYILYRADHAEKRKRVRAGY